MLSIGRLFRRNILDDKIGAGNERQEDLDLIRATPIFDELWYREKHPDLTHAQIEMARHYLEYGANEGRDPGPFFSTQHYKLLANLKEGDNPLLHFLRTGAREKINPSENFDISYYSWQMVDEDSPRNPLEHYIVKGRKKGLHPIPPMSGWREMDLHFDASRQAKERRNLIIAVPLYKNKELLAPLVESLEKCFEEILECNARIIFIVDSPDDEGLREEINARIPRLSALFDVQVIFNQINIGFVRSCNVAMNIAAKEQADLILLNSDVEIYPGALSEMSKVAGSDNMIGFVSPRSNNATICSIPVASKFSFLTPAESYYNYEQVRPSLERVEYVPTAVGFCLYIKFAVLAACGGFDPIYGRGYNEENDLIMRANRLGYRAAIANHAFVYHVGEKSFGLLEAAKTERDRKNALILDERYPEYAPSVHRYFSSSSFKAITLLDGLVRDTEGKLSIAFDWTSVGEYHNGTFRAARTILEIFSHLYGSKFNLYVIATPATFRFHGLSEISGLTRLSKDDNNARVSAVVRIGQPFDSEALTYARNRAPVLLIFMLDTIALDCLYLSCENADDLYELWESTFAASDVIFFNSTYTEEQFRKRFRIPSEARCLSVLHSTSVVEYVQSKRIDVGEYILVVGNKFYHKGISGSLEIIKRYKNARFKIFGYAGENTESIQFIDSGGLSNSEAEALFANASCVLFPSHYEGFGFPIMTALAYKKPVFARRVPVFKEIIDRCPEGTNVHLFDTTRGMIDAAVRGGVKWNDVDADRLATNWVDTANAIFRELEKSVANVKQGDLASKIRAASRNTQKAPLANKSRGALAVLAKCSSINVGNEWQELRRRLRTARGLERKFLEASLIAISPFFDRDFYLREYRDVRLAGVDPVSHFAEHGWKEGRNPSALFNTSMYRSEHSAILDDHENPLVHYMEKGLFSGLSIYDAEAGERYAPTPSDADVRDAGWYAPIYPGKKS